jgi:hypothetical protein
LAANANGEPGLGLRLPAAQSRIFIAGMLTHHLAVGVPVPPEIRDAVRTLVESIGERAVVERLAVSRMALLRIIAGMPVRRGTIALCRIGLATLTLGETPNP